MTFGAIEGAAAVKQPYKLELHLAGPIKASLCRFDVASTNMMVVIHKAPLPDGKAPGMWQSLEAAAQQVQDPSVVAKAPVEEAPTAQISKLGEERSKLGVQQFFQNKLVYEID